MSRALNAIFTKSCIHGRSIVGMKRSILVSDVVNTWLGRSSIADAANRGYKVVDANCNFLVMAPECAGEKEKLLTCLSALVPRLRPPPVAYLPPSSKLQTIPAVYRLARAAQELGTIQNTLDDFQFN